MRGAGRRAGGRAGAVVPARRGGRCLRPPSAGAGLAAAVPQCLGRRQQTPVCVRLGWFFVFSGFIYFLFNRFILFHFNFFFWFLFPFLLLVFLLFFNVCLLFISFRVILSFSLLLLFFFQKILFFNAYSPFCLLSIISLYL